MIKDKDFRFCFGENLANIGIDHLEGDDTLDDIGYYINIMTGEFSGVDFKYRKVSFSPPEENIRVEFLDTFNIRLLISPAMSPP